jgi:hypothetical protein
MLTIIMNKNNEEWSDGLVSGSANDKGIERPAKIKLEDENAVRAYIQTLEETDGTAEGLVLRDRNDLRVKVKSSTYLAYSRLGNNGNIATDSNLVPLIMANEQDEAIAIFVSIKPRVIELQKIIQDFYEELLSYYNSSVHIDLQKDFAIHIRDCRFSSLLFKNRKNNGTRKDLDTLFRDSSDLILKLIK